MKEVYNEKGKKVSIELSDKKEIGEGVYGNVYEYDENFVIKKFGKCRSYTTQTVMVGEHTDEKTFQVLSTLKDMELNNTYKIDEIYFNGKNKLSGLYGYKMQYYHKAGINVIDVDTNYIIQNYLGLMEDFINFSEKGIYVKDFHLNNIILENEKIILIDADSFSKFRIFNKGMLLRHNIKELKKLFLGLFYREFKKIYSGKDLDLVRDSFDSMFFDNTFDIRIFSNYESINDYVCQEILNYGLKK